MIKDLIESIGISQNTIYRICNEGSLVKYKYCGKNYWRTDEVKKYLIKKGVLITKETV
jgi:predicted DNA-binding transcriptional regulator AlpA